MFKLPFFPYGLLAAAFSHAMPIGMPLGAARPAGHEAAYGKLRTRRHYGRRFAGTDVQAGLHFLHRRRMHPGHASSVRKIQRAFRIAGQSFTTGGLR